MRDLRLRSDDLASASPPGAGAWVFPRQPPRGPRAWRLKRNCALRPHQYLAAMGLLMGLSALVAIACWIRGIWLVPVFCAIELAAVAVAALTYARHAIDGETVTLTEDGQVRVEVDRGLRHARYLFPATRLRLIRSQVDELWLVHGTTRLHVGQHVAPALRDAFEGELRTALRRASGT